MGTPKSTSNSPSHPTRANPVKDSSHKISQLTPEPLRPQVPTLAWAGSSIPLLTHPLALLELLPVVLFCLQILFHLRCLDLPECKFRGPSQIEELVVTKQQTFASSKFCSLQGRVLRHLRLCHSSPNASAVLPSFCQDIIVPQSLAATQEEEVIIEAGQVGRKGLIPGTILDLRLAGSNST